MAKSSFWRSVWGACSYGLWPDLGLLIGRLMFGGIMALSHGWVKLSGFSEMATKFADPIGLGAKPSLVLAIFAEFFCAILVMAGALTRLATIPLITTMGVAFFIVHRADPFPRKELALMFLTAWVVLLLTGPGRFSVDYLLAGGRRTPR